MQTTIRWISLARISFVAALFASTPAAAGKPLTTPPLLPSGPSAGIFCEVVNVSTRPIEVTVEIIRSDGVQDGFCGSLALNPGEVLDCGGGVTSFHSRYCRFTGANKKQVRASIVSRSDNGAGQGVPTAALPAQ